MQNNTFTLLAIIFYAYFASSHAMAEQKPTKRFTANERHRVGFWDVRTVYIDGKYFACDANIYSNAYKLTPIRNISIINTPLVMVQVSADKFKGLEPKKPHHIAVKFGDQTVEKNLVPNKTLHGFVVLFTSTEFDVAVQAGSLTFDLGTASQKIELSIATNVYADLKKCAAR
jgi:hypothetical protein